MGSLSSWGLNALLCSEHISTSGSITATISAFRIYLEAVLIRHKLLGFPLVNGLCRAPRRLCGHGSSAGAVSAFCQVEVCYLDADLITHDVLELGGGGGERSSSVWLEAEELMEAWQDKMTQEIWREERKDAYLPDDALDELVHCEGDVSMNGEHFPQRILVLWSLHISVQKISNHLQKGRVVIFHLNVH